MVLRDVNLTLSEGELVSIMGPSGCGKSTLLNILGTLDKPDSGELWIDSLDVGELSDAELSQLRSEIIGFVFQFHHLLPEFSLHENLMIPQLLRGVNREDARKRSLQLLTKVDLAKRQDHKPNAVSGGERQRVAVLRALVNEPKLILADEPTGNLDLDAGRHIMRMIRELVTESGQTFLIVTHNPDVAGECQRNLTLKDGKVSGN